MPSRECRDSTVSATVLAVLLIVTSLSPLALAEETENDEVIISQLMVDHSLGLN